MASSAKKSKGVVNKLNTFLKWGKSNIIGHNVETLDSINHPIIKGAAVNAVPAFADGTEVVTKFQVGLNFHVSLYAENKLISILNSE